MYSKTKIPAPFCENAEKTAPSPAKEKPPAQPSAALPLFAALLFSLCNQEKGDI